MSSQRGLQVQQILYFRLLVKIRLTLCSLAIALYIYGYVGLENAVELSAVRIWICRVRAESPAGSHQSLGTTLE